MLTLPMLSLLSSKTQGCNDFCKPSQPCYVGIHWIALAEYSQMSTHVPRFQSFFRFLHHFLLGKLATSSIRVNTYCQPQTRQPGVQYFFSDQPATIALKKWHCHVSLNIVLT